MRLLLVAAGAAVIALAQPALAQQSGNQQGTHPGQQQNMNPAQVRQSIENDLKQAGYTNVQVVPEAFMVHARDKQGHPVTMMVEPGSVTAVTNLSQSSGTQSGHPAQQSGSAANH